MEFKEKLAQKIESEAKLLEVCDARRLSDLYLSENYYAKGGLRFADMGGVHITNAPWWMYRESMRLEEGVYETSDILTRIVQNTYVSQFMPHVSKDDRAMIAYTPSSEDGERDKQIKTTMGRFLRKHFITLTDKQIQKLEQDHAAEVNATVLYATTADDIVRVYTEMDGDTGCMRKSGDYYGMTNDLHPSMVYEAPGIAIAYTQTADGTVKSRAVTYINPADSSDKRYIRIYGAPVLGRLLEREGYKCSEAIGMKLKKVPFVPYGQTEVVPNKYVLSYIDGAGGNQGTSVFVVDKGDGFLTVIDREECIRIQNIKGGTYNAGAKTTSGSVYVEPLPSGEVVSILTGVTLNRYTQTIVKVMRLDGVIGEASKEEMVAEFAPDGYRNLNTAHEGKMVNVNASTTLPYFYNSGYWIDTAENRTHCGYFKLSAELYPDAFSNWAAPNTVTTVIHNGNQVAVLTEDTISVIPETGDIIRVHKSVIPEMRKQGYMNCVVTRGRKTIIHKKRATFKRTEGGAAFDTVLHADKYAQRVDGAWMRKVDMTGVNILGTSYWIARSTDWHDHITAEMLQAAVRGTASGTHSMQIMDALSPEGMTVDALDAISGLIKDYGFKNLDRYVGYVFTTQTDGNGVPQALRYNHSATTWEQYITCKNAIKANDDYLDFTRKVEAIELFVNTQLAKLAAFREQLEMEAAGQYRLDTLPADIAAQVEELDALPTPPAVHPDDQLLADLAAPVVGADGLTDALRAEVDQIVSEFLEA